MRRIAIAVLALATGLAAASIDGKWVAQFDTRGRAGNAAARAQNVEVILDLKSEGTDLKGTVTMGAGRRSRENPIVEGKIEGEKFSFTTVQKNQQGEVKINWTGTVKGDELVGERTREGARRGVPFTAKRKN